MTNDRFVPLGFAARRRPHGFLAPFMWLAGAIATLAAMAVGVVLALFTAAAVATIAVFAGALVFLAGLAMRARRTVGVKSRRNDDVIEAQKIDGTWVAYGWERPGR